MNSTTLTQALYKAVERAHCGPSKDPRRSSKRSEARLQYLTDEIEKDVRKFLGDRLKNESSQTDSPSPKTEVQSDLLAPLSESEREAVADEIDRLKTKHGKDASEYHLALEAVAFLLAKRAGRVTPTSTLKDFPIALDAVKQAILGWVDGTNQVEVQRARAEILRSQLKELEENRVTDLSVANARLLTNILGIDVPLLNDLV